MMRSFFAALLLAVAIDAFAQTTNDLVEQAKAAEARGDGKAAVKAYIGAARGGSADAARRLSQIYEKGELGVKADHAESMKWSYYGQSIGEQKGGWGCPPKCAK